MNILQEVTQTPHTEIEERSPEVLTNGGYEDDFEVFHRRFDPHRESIVNVLATSVSLIKNSDVSELEPINETIDTTALEALITKSVGGATADQVSFLYEGFRVTIDSDGNLWLEWD